MTQTPIQLPIPTPFPIGPVNSYLFLEPEPTLIDTGVYDDASWQALCDQLARFNLTPADIKRVVITHAHVDHMGMAAAIARASGCQVWVSDVVYPWAVDLPAMWQTRMHFLARELSTSGLPENEQAKFISNMNSVPAMWESIPTAQITTFDRQGNILLGGVSWQVIYTPGHAVTQTCFYEPTSRQFIAADMLLPKTPTPVIERPIDGSQERVPGLPQFLESLDLVASIDIDATYPGHGDPFGDPSDLIKKQRERIHARKEQCFELIGDGIDNISQLLDAMYATHPRGARLSALGMLIGYLDLLQIEERVQKSSNSGVFTYRPI